MGHPTLTTQYSYPEPPDCTDENHPVRTKFLAQGQGAGIPRGRFLAVAGEGGGGGALDSHPPAAAAADATAGRARPERRRRGSASQVPSKQSRAPQGLEWKEWWGYVRVWLASDHREAR